MCISLVALFYAKSHFFMHETHHRAHTPILCDRDLITIWLTDSAGLFGFLFLLLFLFDDCSGSLLFNSSLLIATLQCIKTKLLPLHYHYSLSLSQFVFGRRATNSPGTALKDFQCLFVISIFRWYFSVKNCGTNHTITNAFFWHLNGNVFTFIFGIKCWRAAFFRS